MSCSRAPYSSSSVDHRVGGRASNSTGRTARGRGGPPAGCGPRATRGDTPTPGPPTWRAESAVRIAADCTSTASASGGLRRLPRRPGKLLSGQTRREALRTPPTLVAGVTTPFYAAWGRSRHCAAIWSEHVTGLGLPGGVRNISFLLPSLSSGPGRWAEPRQGSTPSTSRAALAVRPVGGQETAAPASSASTSPPVAINVATARVLEVGMDGRATFQQGTFDSTGIEAAAS